MVPSYIDFAISAMLAASAVVPIVYSVASRREREDKPKMGGIKVSTDSVSKMLGRGYAYTVDIGDSLVVVVVFNKGGISRSFADAEPTLIEAVSPGGEAILEAG